VGVSECHEKRPKRHTTHSTLGILSLGPHLGGLGVGDTSSRPLQGVGQQGGAGQGSWEAIVVGSPGWVAGA